MALFLDSSENSLSDSSGKRFYPEERCWQSRARTVSTNREITLQEAVRWLQKKSGVPCRIPVAVIGGRQASTVQMDTAEKIGAGLGEMGLTLICGGREGIMQAACKGARRFNGMTIGLLPDADPALANPYITVPIATGIGVARNALIARAALCLIAIGGGHGTLSEAAFGLQFEKAVFILADGPQIKGVHLCNDLSEVLDGVARTVLALS